MFLIGRAVFTLEIVRGETDEALSTLADIMVLIDRGVAGSFAVGAAVSFAALLAERDSPKAIAILEKVRDRYPELARSEEVAALEFLEGRLLTWGTRPDLAEARLTGAFLSFRDLGLVHDAALAALALILRALEVSSHQLFYALYLIDSVAQMLEGAEEGWSAGVLLPPLPLSSPADQALLRVFSDLVHLSRCLFEERMGRWSKGRGEGTVSP